MELRIRNCELTDCVLVILNAVKDLESPIRNLKSLTFHALRPHGTLGNQSVLVPAGD